MRYLFTINPRTYSVVGNRKSTEDEEQFIDCVWGDNKFGNAKPLYGINSTKSMPIFILAFDMVLFLMVSLYFYNDVPKSGPIYLLNMIAIHQLQLHSRLQNLLIMKKNL
jgi:hypothetical protein